MRDDRGSAVVEFSWLAVMLLVPLVYVLITVFDVQRNALGATEAARAAGRAFQLAPDEETGRQRAEAAARVALADQHVELDPSALVITCDPECLQPGSTVTVSLELSVSLPLVPDVLGADRPAVRVSASHTESYGAYHSGKG